MSFLGHNECTFTIEYLFTKGKLIKMISSGKLDGRKAQRRRKPLEDSAIEAAEHVFAWKGYQQATMDLLAREAGIAVGSLYNLFRNKEEIYSRVAQRVGEMAVRRIEPLASDPDPEIAALNLIRLRLCNYSNDCLFFQPFSFPTYLAVQPKPERLGPEVNRLHELYVDLVERIFQRCVEQRGQTINRDIKMATCLEGLVTAYLGRWARPPQSDSLSKVAKHLKAVLLHEAESAMTSTLSDEAEAASEDRAIFISRYDLGRLRELIEVVRVFGNKENRGYVDILNDALKRARVVDPLEVPQDVITMNSRVRIGNPNTGTDRVYRLVFPREADMASENISVLDPFGTTILGRRLQEVFTVGSGEDAPMYEVSQILYQPEGYGDYQL